MPASPTASTPATRRNLERKARVTPEALDEIRQRARRIATGAAFSLRQDDRYFTVPDRRLKLRVITSDTGETRAELIAYRRPDRDGSRWSDYRVTPVAPADADDLAATLALALPPLVRVRKHREVVIAGATRIHLDRVDGLGAFVELETVIGDQDTADAEREHQEVIAALGLDDWPVEAGSYSDLLRGRDDAPELGA